MRNVIVGAEQVDIDKLSPHPRNARQGDVGAISASIQTHGLYRPIIAQRSTGIILAGNHTWQACKRLGMKKVWVSWVEVDNDEAVRILLIDNKTSDLASYDDNELVKLLQALMLTPDELTGTGYDADELNALLQIINSTTSVTELEREKELEKEKHLSVCPECGHEF